MNRSARVLMVFAVIAALLTFTGCNKLKARDRLNKGVQAYKGGKFEAAIEQFKEAVALDPKLLNAKLYLATAYAQQYIPGVESDENNRMGMAAIETYEQVLQQDPGNINSHKGIAYIYLQMKKFDDAKKYYRKVIDLDPQDPEAYYSVAVIDWTQSYQPRMEARAKAGLQNQPTAAGEPDPLSKDKKVCAEIREKNEPVVKEGIEMLQKAIELRQDYDDAMAYLNLMYRERADIQCDDPEARKADLKMADEWVEKTMATKKAKAEKEAAPGGIVLDQPAQQQ